jgi:site-specific DNA-cytosine methylase
MPQQLVNGLGYTVEYRELRACDYGAPTIRKRFFMVMRRDGQPIVWPEATHGDPKSPAVLAGKLAPWRTAAECIDWSIPPSIFDRKKPLAENTLKRIARGIQRFVIDSASPFIVKCNHTRRREIRLFPWAGAGRSAADDYENPRLRNRGTAPDKIPHRRHRAASHRTGTNGDRRHVKTPGREWACVGYR